MLYHSKNTTDTPDLSIFFNFPKDPLLHIIPESENLEYHFFWRTHQLLIERLPSQKRYNNISKQLKQHPVLLNELKLCMAKLTPMS